MHSNRGLSETIGFVLVFAVITMTIGIVYASGFAGLHNAQQQEQLVNVQRAFDVLNDNLRDIHQERAPSRTTEIKLSGGTLSLGNTSRFSFNTSSTELGNCNISTPLSATTRPIIYEDERSSVVYEAGSVIRTDNEDAAMITSPAWVLSKEKTVISFVNIIPENTADSIGGHSTVLIVATRESNVIDCQIDTAGTFSAEIIITTSAARSKAWEQFYERKGYDVSRNSDTEVVVKYETEELLLSNTFIEIDITD